MNIEEELIQKCLNRERKAQKELYDKYSSIMMGVCRRYASDKSTAEDILQEGFTKVFLHLKTYNGTGSFTGWIKRIMINTAISYYHKYIKTSWHDELDLAKGVDDGHEQIGEQDYSYEELLKVINELPHGFRMVFNLYAIEGYKHREIAEILDIDTGTSKSQYSRARKIIQDKLAELKNIKK
jgi:RNA polymerase sigma factor (sigma-70 family)